MRAQAEFVAKLSQQCPETSFVINSKNPLVFIDSESGCHHPQCALSMDLGDLVLVEQQRVLQQPSLLFTDFLYNCKETTDLQNHQETHSMIMPGIQFSQPLMCISQKHGLLAFGTEGGLLGIFSTEKWKHPLREFGSISAFVKDVKPLYFNLNNLDCMINSIDITMRTVLVNDKELVEFNVLAALNDEGIYVLKLEMDSEFNFSRTKEHFTFGGQLVNDIKISPDHRFALLVCDNNMVWYSRLHYYQDNDDGEDDDWESAASTDFDLTDLEILTEEQDTSLPLWKFSRPCLITVPVDGFDYCFQHMSCSSDSRYFAASCDTKSCVLIGEMEAEPIIKVVVPVAEPTLAIAFHPKDPNLLAVSYKRGYTHILNIEPLRSINGELNGYLPPLQHQSIQTFQFGHIQGLKWSENGELLYIAQSALVTAFRLSKVQKLSEMCLQLLYISMKPKTGLLPVKLEWMDDLKYQLAWCRVQRWGQNQYFWPFYFNKPLSL